MTDLPPPQTQQPIATPFVPRTELQVSPLGMNVVSLVAPGLQLTTFIDATMMTEACRRFLEAQKQAQLAASLAAQKQSRALAHSHRSTFIYPDRPIAAEQEEVSHDS